MKAVIREIYPIFLLFLYIYPQTILGFPISTRIIMGMFSLLILLKRFCPTIFVPLKGSIAIGLFSIITAVYNTTYDFKFLWYLGSMLLILLAAYFFFSLFPQYTENCNSINAVLKIFVIAVLIQSIAAVTMFVFPTLGEILQNIFPIVANETQLELSMGFRLLGLGTAFFGAGVTNGLALIIIVYLYLRDNIQSIIIWMPCYLFIFFAGLMMARTTVVGFVISLLLLLTWKPLGKKSISKKLKWTVSFIIALVLAVSFMLVNTNEDLLNFAFEFFYNYEKSGSFESASTNDMLTMYRWPEDLKTWLIGDGMFNTKNGYYMKTDIGFLRLLYYGGIPIILAYFYFSWYIILKIRKLGIDRLLQYFLTICFVYQIVLNAKGLVDLNYFFFLVFLCIYKSRKRRKAYNTYPKANFNIKIRTADTRIVSLNKQRYFYEISS